MNTLTCISFDVFLADGFNSIRFIHPSCKRFKIQMISKDVNKCLISTLPSVTQFRLIMPCFVHMQ